MKRSILIAIVGLLLCGCALGQPAGADDVYARVVDVGAGLCCVVRMPGNHYMVYDAGNYTDSGASAFDAVREIIPEGEEIDLMVLSHSDSDHQGAVDEICDAYDVKRVIRSGLERSSGTWRDADAAIRLEKERHGCIDINLKDFEFPPGGTYRFGDTFVTMVFGLHKPPEDWTGLSQAEERNATSIVMRLVYKGRSILFCGDTVGRHIGAPENQLIAAEKAMIDNAVVIPIDSDVMIAPHHGADNASTPAFIAAVSPTYVVFSAGHRFEHPTKVAAERYVAAGVPVAHMFRTDRGDDEGAAEWDHERVNGQHDSARDDDVEIVLRADGSISVAYR